MDVLTSKPEWLSQLCRHVETMAVEPVDLTLSDLANEAGLTPRALQYAFKQHLNTTPMRWLRQQKLKQVHQTLKSQRKETTVTQAAIASGFTNLGVFARYYREEFGEKPSQTLVG